MSAFSRFIEELRRRRVFRVTSIYAVAVFAVFQAVDIVLPALHLPEWTVTLTVVLGLLGFPVAVGLAWAFDLTGGKVRRATAGRPDPDSRRRGGFRRPWLAAAAGVAAIGLVGIGAWLVLRSQDVRIAAASLDANRIAVMPFRVGGASSDLSYLREGMVDLLATTLFADDGTHAVDAPSVLRTWRRAVASESEDLPTDSARTVARGLGAAWVVVGGIIGTPGSMTVTVELIEVASERVRARPRLSGSTDTLTALVDRLAGEVMATVAGETEERTSLIAGVPLAAIRAYLTGRSETRRGHYVEAFSSHAEALRIDSTFVPAALGMIEAAGWDAGTPDQLNRARSVVAGRIDDLPPVERLGVLATIGPRYPAPTSSAELIGYAQQMRQAAPHSPESALQLAEWLFHEGAILDVPDADERAAELFAGIIGIDSSNAGVLEHLAELALKQGDSAAVRRLTDRYRTLDPDRFLGNVMEWYRLIAVSDTIGLLDFRTRLATMQTSTLWVTTVVGRLVGSDLETVDRAADELLRRNSAVGFWAAANVARTRGRPDRAADVLDAGRRAFPQVAYAFDVLAILHALYADGDRDDAASAAARIEADERDGSTQPVSLCTLEQWRLWNGDTDHAMATAATLRTQPVDSTAWTHLGASFCAMIVETIAAAVTDRPDAGSLLERLDSATSTDPATGTDAGATSQALVATANRVISRLSEERGDSERALRATRRQYNFGGTLPFLASRLRDQARLAEMTGDRQAASRALRYYIILRSDPEPSMLPDLERARADLVRLTGGDTGRR